MTTKQRFEISGSHGTVVTDSEGTPLAGQSPIKPYFLAERFDVAEYRDWHSKYWPNDNLIADVVSVDILHIGFWWTDNGKKAYSPADEGGRKFSLYNAGLILPLTGAPI